MQNAQWDGKTRGGTFGQRSLFALLRHINIRAAYALIVPALPFFLLSRPHHLRAIYRYFRYRQGHTALGAALRTVGNYYVFGQVVLDKFYLLSGSRNPFKISIEGIEHYDHACAQPSGFMILSSHVGNYELAGYSLKSVKPMNAIVFGGENAYLQQNRNNTLSINNITPIPVAADMSHLFVIKGALERGEVVSIPGDRIFGSSKSIACTLLGVEAHLPLGPFITAAQLNVKTLAIFVMKERGLRYRIYIKPLEQAQLAANSRQTAHGMAQQFAQQLEQMVRKYPAQWFNYYDFWQTPANIGSNDKKIKTDHNAIATERNLRQG